MKRIRNLPVIGALLLHSSVSLAQVVAEFPPVDDNSSSAPPPPVYPPAQPRVGVPGDAQGRAWTPPPPPASVSPLPVPETRHLAPTAPVPAAPSAPAATAPAPSASATPFAPPASRSGPVAAAPSLVSLQREPRLSDGVSDRGVTATDTNGEDSSTTHSLSLTFSAARAIASLYEVTAEVALGDNVSIALLGGLGGMDAEHPSYPYSIRLSGRELGAQARVYVLGDFDDGLMLGGEAAWVWADATPTLVTDSVVVNGVRYNGTALLSGEGTLTGLGAFIGYKMTAKFGLTFDVKLGWQRLLFKGTGRMTGEAMVNGQRQRRTEDASIRESLNVPLFNLNLGWSI
jgi:hypothetical protein